MTRRILNSLVWLCGLAAVWFIVGDLRQPAPSRLLGAVWYEAHPGSLQVTEAVISRFIDPCGLIVALECSPFLWHPLIASLLTLPAGMFFALMTGILLFVAQFFKSPRGRRAARNLRRDGR